jgi:hypothetical protein
VETRTHYKKTGRNPKSLMSKRNKKESKMKKHVVFLKKNDLLSKVGDSKDEFDWYVLNNSEGIIQWTGPEIEESLNNGGVEEGHPLVVELLDNKNEWATCTDDANIIYTQKQLDTMDFFSLDCYDSNYQKFVVYFKEINALNDEEKKLIEG